MTFSSAPTVALSTGMPRGEQKAISDGREKGRFQ
jgi:hypothetical protein